MIPTKHPTVMGLLMVQEINCIASLHPLFCLHYLLLPNSDDFLFFLLLSDGYIATKTMTLWFKSSSIMLLNK